MNVTWIVIDGFGIGAMPDAGDLRAEDAHADTLGSLDSWARTHLGRPLEIPNLATLGLALLRPDLKLRTKDPVCVSTARRTALGYPGADTFAGHQTMMGADMSHAVVCRLSERLDDVTRALKQEGHEVSLYEDHEPLLIVDGEVLVHDNLEADPGLNWNVSGRLDHIAWDDLLSIGRCVRKLAPVARVITVGGISHAPLTAYVRAGDAGTLGMDTPMSGFYTNGGLKVQHLGIAIDHSRQLPQLATDQGLDVTLVGKTADILETDTPVRRLPNVDTTAILKDTLDASRHPGLVLTNIQQTDLAGHQQDPRRYTEVVEKVDRIIGQIIDELAGDSHLVVVADHGNDPAIGHGYHTREFVPVLMGRTAGLTSPSEAPSTRAGHPLSSLADVGASVGALLGIPAGRIGYGTPRDLMGD